MPFRILARPKLTNFPLLFPKPVSRTWKNPRRSALLSNICSGSLGEKETCQSLSPSHISSGRKNASSPTRLPAAPLFYPINFLSKEVPTIATSSIITNLKNQVIQEINADSALTALIESSSETLPGSCLFPYKKLPEINTSIPTYLTVQVHLFPSVSGKAWVRPTLELWIFSSPTHILIEGGENTESRNDAIARLLDEKFNGRSDLGGFGPLSLVSSREGAIEDSYYYRRLIFETKDLNAKR